MFGFIILAYPLSVVIGIWAGASRGDWRSVPLSAGIGAALAALFSMEYVIDAPFGQLVREMMLPASAFCAGFGAVGAVVGLGFKALLKAFRQIK